MGWWWLWLRWPRLFTLKNRRLKGRVRTRWAFRDRDRLPSSWCHPRRRNWRRCGFFWRTFEDLTASNKHHESQSIKLGAKLSITSSHFDLLHKCSLSVPWSLKHRHVWPCYSPRWGSPWRCSGTLYPAWPPQSPPPLSWEWGQILHPYLTPSSDFHRCGCIH